MLKNAGLDKWFWEGKIKRKYSSACWFMKPGTRVMWAFQSGHQRQLIKWRVASAVSNFLCRQKIPIAYDVISTVIISKILLCSLLKCQCQWENIPFVSDIWFDGCSKYTYSCSVNGESSTVTTQGNYQYLTWLSFYFLCGKICIFVPELMLLIIFCY